MPKRLHITSRDCPERYSRPSSLRVAFRLCCFASVFDEVAQPAKSVVPLLRDQAEIMPCLGKALPFQSPNALAPAPCVAHQPGALHHAQMFCDRLAANLELRGQLGDGHCSIAAAPSTHTPA